MGKKNIIRFIAAIGIAGFLSLGIYAAQAQEGGVVYKKRTVIDFDDDTIEGDLSRPDGEYLESRKKRKHKNLIKIRKNFRAEILQSVRGL